MNNTDLDKIIYECDVFLSNNGIIKHLKCLQSYKLLHCFILKDNKILTFNELQNILGWTKGSIVVRVCKLRKEIQPIKILSVRKIGYRLFYRR